MEYFTSLVAVMSKPFSWDGIFLRSQEVTYYWTMWGTFSQSLLHDSAWLSFLCFG